MITQPPEPMDNPAIRPLSFWRVLLIGFFLAGIDLIWRGHFNFIHTNERQFDASYNQWIKVQSKLLEIVTVLEDS
jgi:hypothetical protein